MDSTNSNHHPNASNKHSKQNKHSNQHLQPPNVHLYTSNALISKKSSLQAPTDALNVHQCTSNTKHPDCSFQFIFIFKKKLFLRSTL